MIVIIIIILYTCCKLLILLIDVDTEDIIFTRIAKVCPNLVEISGKSIDVAGLRALGRLNGACLLSIQFDHISTGEISLDKSIDVFCKGNPHLKKLRIAAFESDATDAAVQSIVKYCPHIEELSLKDWTDITYVSLTYLMQLQSLREIDLSCCDQLTSSAVQGLLMANRNLESLVLSNVSGDVNEEIGTELIDDALLRCIGLHCPRLAKLHMHIDEVVNPNITSASFEAMIKGLPALEELRIAEFCQPNTILCMLGTYCPRLRHVYIDNIRCWNDDGLAAMCRGCPLIESLILYPRLIDNISDIFIQTLATSCHSLRELHISNNDRITDLSLCTLFTATKHLTSVKFYGLTVMTDRAILTLLRCCPQLKELTLWGRSRVTDYSLLAVATHCPQLLYLSLNGMSTLTHETIVQVSRYCKQLQALSIEKCDKINNTTVIEVLGNCKHLTDLDIYLCNIKVTDEFETQCDQLASARSYRGMRLKYSKERIRSY